MGCSYCINSFLPDNSSLGTDGLTLVKSMFGGVDLVLCIFNCGVSLDVCLEVTISGVVTVVVAVFNVKSCSHDVSTTNEAGRRILSLLDIRSSSRVVSITNGDGCFGLGTRCIEKDAVEVNRRGDTSQLLVLALSQEKQMRLSVATEKLP